MRLGLSDAFSVTYPKFEWAERAAKKLGHTTVRIRSERDLHEANQCDLVLFSQNYTVPPFLVSPPKTIWVFDLIGHGIGDTLRDCTPWHEFDAVFCKNPQDVPGGHPHCYWLDQAAPDWPPLDYPRLYDVILPGRPRKPRVEALKRLATQGYRIGVAGHGWCTVLAALKLPIDDLGNCLTEPAMQKLFGSAKVIIGDDYARLPGYWSDRRWLAAAAGTPYLNCQSDAGHVLNNWQLFHELAVKAASENRYHHRLEELLTKVSALDLVHCGNPG